MPADDDRPAVIPSTVDPDVECVRIDMQVPSGETATPPPGPPSAGLPGDGGGGPPLCPEGYVPRRRSQAGYTLEGKRAVRNGPPTRNPADPLPFGEFLDSVAGATYDDIRSLPGSAVESPAAFEEMRAYLLDLYRGVAVETSLTERDGQVIDCIPDPRHPALRQLTADLPAPGAQPAPEAYNGIAPPGLPPAGEESSPPPRDGTPASRPYPPGTRPLYRTTLEQLARYPNLAAFSAKDTQPSPDAPRAPAALVKHYATGEQDVDCLGGGSNVNVWQPFATPTFQATFSQQWYLAGQDGTLLQTVECGWHIDITRYQGSAEPHLFVYSTRQNYDTGHSFFNLDGGAFVPVTNPYVLPGSPLQVSQTDGNQVEYKMGFYLTNGAWVFYFDDHPIGAYPLSWFQGGPLTQGAKRAKFGGEVGSGCRCGLRMGSGQPASAGDGKAAYHRAAFVNPVAGGAQFVTLAEAGSTSGPCYTIDITNNSASDWGTYLFFGGPGGTGC